MKYTLASILLIFTLSHAQSTCPNPTYDGDCKHCTSHDDPHFVTWDGVRYDQHTEGCFKYITTCPLAAYDIPFEVCGCHYTCGGGGDPTGGKGCPSNIRCVGDITVTFFDSGVETFIVTVDIDNPSDDAIDALSTSLTSGTTYTFDPSTGYYFIYTKTMGYSGMVHTFEIFSDPSGTEFYAQIRYQPGNFEAHLSEDYFNDVTCGLCGKFSLINTDDFTESDGSINVSPSDVGGPIDAIIESEINAFANTYLCNSSAPIPSDSGCALDADTLACIADALVCCGTLWAETVGTWANPVFDEGVFRENWGTNCALDACALTRNNVSCDEIGDEFTFAENIAIQTATAVYDWTPIETGQPTVSPTDEAVFESNCTAKVCAHGDDKIQLDVSYDGGSTWDVAVASENDWKDTMIAAVNPIDADTVLRFTVKDTKKKQGGFLATVQLCGTNDYVFVRAYT